MTLRNRFIAFWHRHVTHDRPRRWDPLIYHVGEEDVEPTRPVETNPDLGWVDLHQLPTFWNTIFDVPKGIRALYYRFLVAFAYARMRIPLDRLV